MSLYYRDHLLSVLSLCFFFLLYLFYKLFVSFSSNKVASFLQIKIQVSRHANIVFKGRFLKFRRYHNFANLFSKLSETTIYKEISKFQ